MCNLKGIGMTRQGYHPVTIYSEYIDSLNGTKDCIGRFLYGEDWDGFGPRPGVDEVQNGEQQPDSEGFETADELEGEMASHESGVDKLTCHVLETLFAWRSPQTLQADELVDGVRPCVSECYQSVQNSRLRGIVEALQGDYAAASGYWNRALDDACSQHLDPWIIQGIAYDLRDIAYHLDVSGYTEQCERLWEHTTEVLRDYGYPTDPYTHAALERLHINLLEDQSKWRDGRRLLDYRNHCVSPLATYAALALALGSYHNFNCLRYYLLDICYVQSEWDDSAELHAVMMKVLLACRDHTDMNSFMNSHPVFLTDMTEKRAVEIARFVRETPWLHLLPASQLMTCHWLGNYLPDSNFKELMKDVHSIASDLFDGDTLERLELVEPMIDALTETSGRQDPHQYLEIIINLLSKWLYPNKVLKMLRYISNPECLTQNELGNLLKILDTPSFLSEGLSIPNSVSAALAHLRRKLEDLADNPLTPEADLKRARHYIRLINDVAGRIPPEKNTTYLLNYPESSEDVRALLECVIRNLESDITSYSEVSDDESRGIKFLTSALTMDFDIPRHFINLLERDHRMLLDRAITAASKTLGHPEMALISKIQAMDFLLWASGGSELVVMDVIRALRDVTEDLIFSTDAADSLDASTPLIQRMLTVSNGRGESDAVHFSYAALRTLLNISNSSELLTWLMNWPSYDDKTLGYIMGPIERLTSADVFVQLDGDVRMGIIELLMGTTKRSKLALRATAFHLLGLLLGNRHVGLLVARYLNSVFEEEGPVVKSIIETAFSSARPHHADIRKDLERRCMTDAHFMIRKLAEGLS